MADDDNAAGNGAAHSTGDRATADKAAGGETATEQLIARFGGLRPLASKLGIAVSTVQGWKTRGHIPPTRTDEIRKAAAEHGITLDEAELAAATAEQPQATEPTEADREPPLEAEHVEGPRPWGTSATAPAGEPARDEPARDEPARDEVTDEEPEAVSPAPAAGRTRPAEARRGSRAGAWTGGLLVGGLLVAGGAAAAVFTQPYWQPYLDAALPGFEQRLGERIDPQLEPLRARLQALESAPAPDGATDRLEADLAALREQVAALSEQAGQAEGAEGAAGGEALEALRQRVADLEDRAGEAGGQDAEALESLRQRVAELGDTLAAAGADPQALEGFRGEVARLSARFDDLSGTTEQLRQALARVEVVQSDLAEVKSRLDSLSDRVEQVGRSGEQDRGALAQRVEANAEAIRQAGDARNQGALLALALGQLREALRFSESYEQELQGVETVAGAAELEPLLEPLRAGAAAGVPNLTALRRRFSELAPEIVGAAYGSGEQGWLREVMDRVPELVTVRPVGQATGDSVGAKVARAERALGDGDLPAAIAEVESLEGEPAELAAPWLAEARARLRVDAALSDLTRRAVTQLSGTPAGAQNPQSAQPPAEPQAAPGAEPGAEPGPAPGAEPAAEGAAASGTGG